MKVVLLDDIDGVGARGQVVDIAAGYARNALIPRRQALPATPATLRMAKELNRSQERKERQIRADAQSKAASLSKLSLTIVANAGEGGKLFGSVTTTDIAEEIARQGVGFPVDKRDVLLAEPIKALGRYTISVKLFRDVRAGVEVWVVPPEGREALRESGEAPGGETETEAEVKADAEGPDSNG